LFGFANITANNGWGMAVVGAAIVFTGLVVLSFVISQIHRILEFWEQRDKFFTRTQKGPAQSAESQRLQAAAAKEQHLPTVKELASIYRPLVTQLKEPFQIIQLFEITKKMDLPHPHLSIRSLQEAGILVAQGDGLFIWDNQKAS
jgi:hypothetical protein